MTFNDIFEVYTAVKNTARLFYLTIYHIICIYIIYISTYYIMLKVEVVDINIYDIIAI